MRSFYTVAFSTAEFHTTQTKTSWRIAPERDNHKTSIDAFFITKVTDLVTFLAHHNVISRKHMRRI